MPRKKKQLQQIYFLHYDRLEIHCKVLHSVHRLNRENSIPAVCMIWQSICDSWYSWIHSMIHAENVRAPFRDDCFPIGSHRNSSCAWAYNIDNLHNLFQLAQSKQELNRQNNIFTHKVRVWIERKWWSKRYISS